MTERRITNKELSEQLEAVKNDISVIKKNGNGKNGTWRINAIIGLLIANLISAFYFNMQLNTDTKLNNQQIKNNIKEIENVEKKHDKDFDALKEDLAKKRDKK